MSEPALSLDEIDDLQAAAEDVVDELYNARTPPDALVIYHRLHDWFYTDPNIDSRYSNWDTAWWKVTSHYVEEGARRTFERLLAEQNVALPVDDDRFREILENTKGMMRNGYYRTMLRRAREDRRVERVIISMVQTTMRDADQWLERYIQRLIAQHQVNLRQASVAATQSRRKRKQKKPNPQHRMREPRGGEVRRGPDGELYVYARVRIGYEWKHHTKPLRLEAYGSRTDLNLTKRFNRAPSVGGSPAFNANVSAFHYRSFRGVDGKMWTSLPKSTRSATFVWVPKIKADR